MTLPVRKSLHDAVLQASKADTWEQATKEWNEVSLIFNGIGRSNCVCGNAIKYAYELFNGVTGQRLLYSSFSSIKPRPAIGRGRKIAQKGRQSDQKSSEKGKNQGQ